MVTYIKIVSEEQQADDREAERFRDLWRASDGPGLPLPWRSLPIKVWALLSEGPLTAAEIAKELMLPDGSKVAEKRVDRAVSTLRKHGQDIFKPHTRANHRRQREYHLVQRRPFLISEGPHGLRLAPRDGRPRGNEVIIELK